MDSNNELEQPKVDSGTSVEQPSSQNEETKVTLSDGTEVSIEELKNWYLRQSDYTKKTTALAEEKRKVSENPELDETKKILQEMWFTTKEELAELKRFKEDILTEKEQKEADAEFNNFAGQFKTLGDSQKNILKDLKKVYPDKSYDEILQSTWFIDQAILDKAKWTGSVKWASLWVAKPKEELKINPKVSQKYNLKSAGEISKIRQQFWI